MATENKQKVLERLLDEAVEELTRLRDEVRDAGKSDLERYIESCVDDGELILRDESCFAHFFLGEAGEATIKSNDLGPGFVISVAGMNEAEALRHIRQSIFAYDCGIKEGKRLATVEKASTVA